MKHYRNHITSLLTLIFIALAVKLSAAPYTYVGERYMWAQGGVIRPGDDTLRQFDDNAIGFSFGVNSPVSPDADVHASVQHMDLDGIVDASMLAIRVGGTYHLLPSSGMDPFGGIDPFIRLSVGWAFADTDAGLTGWRFENNDEYLLDLALGAQVSLGEDITLTPALSYERIGDNDDIVIGVGFNMMVYDPMFWSINLAYRFEDKDIELNTGLGYKF